MHTVFRIPIALSLPFMCPSMPSPSLNSAKYFSGIVCDLQTLQESWVKGSSLLLLRSASSCEGGSINPLI